MNNQLEQRHIRYFLAVAEELHFRKAAEKLFISQPGLSRQIKEMEAILGYKVLKRNNRSVSLTEAGAFLKAEFHKLQGTLDHMLEQARQIDKGGQGDLRVGYVGSAMQRLIPELLVSFKQTFPDVLFSLKEMGNHSQIIDLLKFKIDLGFVRMTEIPAGLESMVVIEEPFCLVVPKNYSLKEKKLKDLSHLSTEPFILFDPDYSPSYYQQVMQIFAESGFKPKVSHNSIHAGTIFELVKSGFGLSIVPLSLCSANNKQVKFVPLDKLPQRTTLTAVWNSENKKMSLTHLVSGLQVLK